MSKVIIRKNEQGKLEGLDPAGQRAAQFVMENLIYEEETGRLTWRTDRRCGRGRVMAHAGAEAGTQRLNGYRLINIYGMPVLAHRIAWLLTYGAWPSQHIDHLNGIRSDNRIANLRDVSRSVNLQNMRQAMVNKKHGKLIGSAWHEGTKKWRAIIRIGGKQKSLGYFETEQEAHEVYVAAKRIHHAGCTL